MDTFTPSAIPHEPYANNPKPSALMIKPKPYLNAAGGLYSECESLDPDGAKGLIRKEFRTETHDGSIPEASLGSSWLSIQGRSPHTIKKVSASAKVVALARFHVRLASIHSAHD